MKKLWTNDAAHQRAVLQARYQARFGRTPPLTVWEQTITAAMARGLSRTEAIQETKKDTTLLAAYEAAAREARTPARQQVQRPAPSATDQRWQAAIAERQKRGLSRVEAILDIRQTDPDLYAARR